jgi:phosphatidylserine decarboxylase
VHVNSSPIAGEIDYVNYVPGKKLNALDPRSSVENEYALMGVKTSTGIKITVRQIAGLIARRIICDVKKGDKVEQCGVVGMIRFGSRAEICIPMDKNFKPSVKVGDKVLCGVTPLGQFK